MNGEEIVENYLRTHLGMFTLTQFLNAMEDAKNPLSSVQCASRLISSEYVFACGEEHFITYAGAFTGKYFSIKPTNEEVSQGMFVAGARCIPFVDCNMVSSAFVFRYKGEDLPRKLGEFNSDTALGMFALQGAEYAFQCVAQEAAMAGGEEIDGKLPPRVRLEGSQMKMKYGDRLICKVANWDEGIIDIVSVQHTCDSLRQSDYARFEWYDRLEKVLLESCVLAGPCASIAAQLSVAFMNNMGALCTRYCGSVGEYLEMDGKVSCVDYGVETRLWRTGEEAPVVGAWNADDDGTYHKILEQYVLPSEAVLGAYVMDQMYRKKIDIDAIVKEAVPSELGGCTITEQDIKYFTLRIDAMYDTLKASYNWFADAPIAKMRSHYLEFYGRLQSLAVYMYNSGAQLDLYPQEPLVIFFQMFGNVLKALSSMVTDSEYVMENMADFNISLHSMEDDFGHVECILRDETEEDVLCDGHGFVVIK